MARNHNTAHLQTPAVRRKRTAAIRAAYAAKKANGEKPPTTVPPADPTLSGALMTMPYASWPHFVKYEAQQILLTLRGKRVLQMLAAGERMEAKQFLVDMLLEPKPGIEDL